MKPYKYRSKILKGQGGLTLIMGNPVHPSTSISFPESPLFLGIILINSPKSSDFSNLYSTSISFTSVTFILSRTDFFIVFGIIPFFLLYSSCIFLLLSVSKKHWLFLIP